MATTITQPTEPTTAAPSLDEVSAALYAAVVTYDASFQETYARRRKPGPDAPIAERLAHFEWQEDVERRHSRNVNAMFAAQRAWRLAYEAAQRTARVEVTDAGRAALLEPVTAAEGED